LWREELAQSLAERRPFVEGDRLTFSPPHRVDEHETPFAVSVGSGTMVSDGVSFVNADYSSTSFRIDGPLRENVGLLGSPPFEIRVRSTGMPSSTTARSSSGVGFGAKTGTTA